MGRDMRINFRTLDRKTFWLDLDAEVAVGDVKTLLEDKLGKEDLFRLIYCGRLLKDDDHVSETLARRRAAEELSEDEEEKNGDEEESLVHGCSSSQFAAERLRPGSGGYITPREFTIALEVIMGMEYLRLRFPPRKTTR